MFHRVMRNSKSAFGLPTCCRLRGTALYWHELDRALAGSGRVLRLDDVERALANAETPPFGIVLTFDDGYAEHLTVARVLAERGLTATFYVATGVHAEGEVAPVDAWYWLIDNATARTGRISLPDGTWYEGALDTLPGKRAWVAGAPKHAFMAAGNEERRAMLTQLARSAECEIPSDLAARLYMTRSDWRELVSLGMRVGAHSVTHAILPSVDDRALRGEVGGSVEAIAQLNSPVAFAYPNGDYDQRVLESLRPVGVSSSVTCRPGQVFAGADPLLLPRDFVSPPVPE